MPITSNIRFLWFLILLYPVNINAETDRTTSAQSPISMPNSVRIATFNIGLDEAREKGQLPKLLENGDYPQAKKSAQIIQTVRPDILLINEIDGNDQQHTLNLYLNKYLASSIGNQKPLRFPHVYMPNCNTGVDSGIHFTEEAKAQDKPTDKYGFGYYDGQYCMAVLSMYPIDAENIRSFQQFLWKDFPNAKLPKKPQKGLEENASESWYSAAGVANFRLSSKTHADVPINVAGKDIHLLISHPTPPVFDGEEDRNGRRNYDEVLFWKHYINGNTSWLTDDSGHKVPGLSDTQRFVILGDLNASILEGDASEFVSIAESTPQRAIERLIDDARVAPGFSEKKDGTQIPTSFGGKENAPDRLWSQHHTAAWKMRADYVLPSAFGLNTVGSGVFWPKTSHKNAALVNDTDGGKSSSDHRLVWLDLTIVD